MKKKIIAFLCAFNMVFYCSIVPSVPVKAEVANIPVAVEMWEGFQTLFFTLGVSLLATDAVDKMAQMEEADQSILSLANDLDTAAAEVLKNDWNEYKENLQYGYCKISNTLWNTLKNSAYTNEVAPAISINSLASPLKNYYISHAGYYLIIRNADSSYPRARTRLFRCDSNVFEIPPVLSYDGISNGYNYCQWTIIKAASYSNITVDTFNIGNSYGDDRDFVQTSFTLNGFDWRDQACTGSTCDYSFMHKTTTTWDNSSIAGNVSQSAYNNALNDIYSVDNDGYIVVDSTGTYPAIVPQDVTDGLITDIDAGTLTWVDSLPTVADTEIDVPDGHLTLPELDALIDGLDIERLETKFPFCIPHDMELLISGAASVSSNAPVIKIPLRLAFRGHVYYDENEAVVIDFNRFNSVVVVFREGFFVLFLLGLVYLTIEILQAFFVVTE